MGITADGWLTWAERFPGPPDKVYSEPNTAQGYVPHSAVGYYAGWLSRLNSTERGPDGRYTDYAAASVHGFIMYDGKVIQHYPFTASCWASGNRRANTTKISFENEGGYDPHDEPLTPRQLASNIRIIEELSAAKGWEPRRPANMQDEDATLLEHNECVTMWGGAATACPSNRMDSLWAAILEDAMTPEERERLKDVERGLAKLRQSQTAQNATIYDQAVKQHQLKVSHEALQGTVWERAVLLATHEHDPDAAGGERS